VFYVEKVEIKKDKNLKLEIMGGKKKFHLRAENK